MDDPKVQTIIADFDTQRQAMSAAEKLFSIGLPRDHLLLRIDERGLGTPASSTAPTTVVEETLPSPADSSVRTEPADDVIRDDTRRGATDAVRDPSLLGRTRVAIRLPCALPASELVQLLRAAGASDIEQMEGQSPHPNPAMWPVVDTANATDVERAVEASRRGASGPGDRSGNDDPPPRS